MLFQAESSLSESLHSVAGRAFDSAGAFRKLSLMLVGMAIGTFAEREPLKTRLLIRARRVALLAFHLCMQAGERELGLGMVEFSGRIFPVRTVVALRAVVTQAAIVHVLVARRAG